MVHLGLWSLLPNDVVLVARLFSRSATPTFIVLFGMMLEIVYLQMIRRGDRRACRKRLLARAIQCYVLYLCVVVAGVIGGQLSPGRGVMAAVFLSQAYFANILKFYALGLLFGIVLLELRVRFGLWIAVLVSVIVWLSYPLIKALPPIPEPFTHFASYLIGAGVESGPSVLQGMTFVALALLLGHAAVKFRSDDAERRRAALWSLTAIVFVAIVAAMLLFLQAGVRPAIENFGNFSYRSANHPGYYVIGSLGAMVLIAVCLLLAPRLSAATRARLNVFGISSLFAYAWGNVILNLVPRQHHELVPGLIFTAIFLLGLYVATAAFQFVQRAHPSDHPIAARLGRFCRLFPDLSTRLAESLMGYLEPSKQAA